MNGLAELLNECSTCHGTGVIRTGAKRKQHVIATCACPTGRAVARSTAAYAVVSAVGALRKAFR